MRWKEKEKQKKGISKCVVFICQHSQSAARRGHVPPGFKTPADTALFDEFPFRIRRELCHPQEGVEAIGAHGTVRRLVRKRRQLSRSRSRSRISLLLPSPYPDEEKFGLMMISTIAMWKIMLADAAAAPPSRFLAYSQALSSAGERTASCECD